MSNLQQLCELYRYQHTESRMTQFLKSKIQGYNQGKLYNIQHAKKDRAQWLQDLKFNIKEKEDTLTQTKQQYLNDLLHPQEAYMKPKKAYYQLTKQPYGSKDPLLKTYQNTVKANLQPIIVDYQLYSQIDTEKQKVSKKHMDYVKTFHDKFGQILTKTAPDFWKLLLFDLLDKILKFKEESDEVLAHQLNSLLPGQQKPIKYLITFRRQIANFLQQSKFLQGKVDIKFDQTKQMKKPKAQKQKITKWLANQQNLKEIDFVKMKDQQLIQKIPTLKRFDHTQYIQFKLQPLPRVLNIQYQKIKVQDFIQPQFRTCFQSEYLNTIQSIVFDHAFNSNQNMLVCAPTGAGKTNIATLSILQAMKQAQSIDNVKVVYISPMKALANELVKKFSTKLPKFKTRESTGDIQLSQRQLATTNILITTPQKWDVTTRKGTSILQSVHLVILDQVHLLNDQRGWVIQSIVARMFRTMERTQRHIRLVALSATLPNYYDVADFLKVDRQQGLFHFDSNYRPVPLLINFIGVKNPKDHHNNMNKKRRIQDIYNQKCYQIALSHLKNDKQVLIFVHSRKQTVKYCQFILQRAKLMNDQHILRSAGGISQKYPNIRDKNLKKLALGSVGFHHAGMVRSDRNIVETMFEKGDIKILLATATLAWGVNLPAYAVIIKGTDIYDPNQSQSRDLSILDVQQMFGRAGRPQYDTKGQATLMSDHGKINHYMGALTNSSPIDSKFLKFLKESLNAQICSGTVTSQDEAFDWLKYTFLAVRLKRVPQIYGCPRGANQAQKQMYFDQFLRQRVNDVLQQLDRMRLIRLDHKNFSVTSTQLGRITSHYYIKCQTMQHFCNALHIYSSDSTVTNLKKKFDYKSDLQLLNILSQCKQFESIKPRLQQMQQLKSICKYWILDEDPDFINKKDKGASNLQDGPMIDTPQKVLLLIQGYLRDLTYENYSLINDTQYVIQNSIRLLRCMLDLCSKKYQAQNVRTILKWCKYVQNRVYKDDSALKQFTKFSYTGYNAMRMKKQLDGFLSQNLYKRFEQTGKTVDEFLQLNDNTQRMALLNINPKNNPNSPIVNELFRFCQYLPKVSVQYTVKPIAQTILKIDVTITPQWKFINKWHSKSQVFWILFDDQQQLLHSETFTIDEQFVYKKREVHVGFYVRYKSDNNKAYRLFVTSDRWMEDQQNDMDINLSSLGVQMDSMPFTQLLPLQPLPTTALRNPLFQSLYTRFKFFNPIQTQIFYTLYQTNKNVLIGAPTGSGKTIMSQLSILHLIKTAPQKKCVYIAPLKSLVKQRIKDWQPRFKAIKKSVVQLSGDFTPDIQALNKADIIITTPEKWDGITRSKQRQYTKKVGLVIFDEIHLLGQDRGAVLQVIVSRMNKQSKVRMIGLSTAMANGTDVAEWFGADQNSFFNFRPTVRPVPIEIHFEGFSQKHYCPRMATMNKPAFNHIKKFSDGKPVIIFVSSRRQTRLTANDLIAYSQMQSKDSCSFVKCTQKLLQRAIQEVHDQYLRSTLSFGIVMHHAGLDNHDRKICQDLFVNNSVQIMIATSTLAWGVNFPARLVIIKGTQFFDPKQHKYVDFQATDLLQMIGRAGRPQFDDRGVAVVYVEQSKKNFYRKFLNDPFPIQSSLKQQIQDHISAQIARSQIQTKQQCIQWITWSFMFRRVIKNPSYYGIENYSNQAIKKFLNDLVDKVFASLQQSKVIQIIKNQDMPQGQCFVMPTEMGFIASAYYLKHQTVNKFNNEIKKGLTFKDLLRILADAQQFKQTPLRHNQDIHNKQLSDIAPYKAKNYGSPQDKTFLLLQMHFFNLPFPIRDYVNDCKLILDSSSRVIMGLIQVAKQKKILDAVLIGIYIQQVIYQGFSCNIPFITYDVWVKMSKQFDGLAGLIQGISKGKEARDYIEKFFKSNVIEYDEHKKKQIWKALDSFPRMNLKLKSHKINPDTNQFMSGPVQQQDEAMVCIQIEKQNYQIPNRMVVQKHTKIKDVTWWIVVADENANQVISLKKLSIKKRVNLKIPVDVPEDAKNNPIKVYLMADCYIGLDQVQKVKFNIAKKQR